MGTTNLFSQTPQVSGSCHHVRMSHAISTQYKTPSMRMVGVRVGIAGRLGGRGWDSILVRSTGDESGNTDTTKSETLESVNQSEEEPIWVRREREREMMKASGQDKELPFGVYLLLSAIVAIAAVGSIFEYANKNPIFDVIYPDSPLYTPILGVFALTGIPSAGYLFFKAVGAANAEAERMDKMDGY